MLSGLVFSREMKEFEIHVITSRLYYDDTSIRLCANEKIEQVTVHRIWTSSFGRKNLIGRAIDYVSFYIFSFIKLLQVVRTSDVIIAKTDPPLISLVCLPVCYMKKAILVNWLQDIFPEVAVRLGIKLPHPLYAVLLHLRNKSLRYADMNIVIGELMREKLLQYGVAADRIKIIENWADTDAVYPIDKADNKLRKEWGLIDSFIIGYSGNIGRGHNFDTILGAARILKDDHTISFLFIGSGAKKEELQNLSERENLNILFQPYQPMDKVSESLSVADVHMVTLNPELEGLIVSSKFYGIMAVGRPVIFIGSHNGEIPRKINKADSGFTVIDGDSQKLVDIIRELQRDSEILQRLGKNAKNYADTNANLNISSNRWYDVLSTNVI